MIDKYSLVKVVNIQDIDTEIFRYAIGIVTAVDLQNEYPYEVLFVGRELNELSKALGVLLWKENQLEVIL